MDGVLRSRRDLRASLEVGLALTGLLFTEPLLGILLSATVIGFWAWDTPRLLQSPSIAFGVLLGLVPAIAWYGYQWEQYGSVFLQEILSPQEFTAQGQWFKLVLFYGLKLSLYSLPWLIFAIYGWQITWKSQYWSWARFILSWSGGYTLLLLLMPGYWEAALIPLFPLLALTVAIALIQLRNFPLIVPYPKPLRLALLGFALISVLVTAAIAFNWPINWLSTHEQPFALLILFFLSFTLIMSANLMDRHRTEFIPILMWGIYVSLVLFVNTPFGLEGFSENYPVKPVASLIQTTVPPNQLIYTSFPRERSSLNFYSNHPVIPAEKKELLKYWQKNKSPYLLVDGETLSSLKKSSVKLLGESVSDLYLITKK
jgi:4-amino-4-deoxy-L-arabinose transferase-like glycosyltransferase